MKPLTENQTMPSTLGVFPKACPIHFNYSPEYLTQRTLEMGEGVLSDTGALVIRTGRFTGRSPKDRFIVQDNFTSDLVDWGKINQAIERSTFDLLRSQLLEHLSNNDVYVKDAYACADPRYRLNVRVVAEKPWSAMFAHNMFNRLNAEEFASFTPDWTVFCAPTYEAPEGTPGLKGKNFAIICFDTQEIIIGGTGYTGEIKKGIFSVLNFLLPTKEGVLPMHCSANEGKDGDTAVFFGLSGTGKTTLSTDPHRKLVGDDEHGWSNEGVFNFEGGCYAKCIDLSQEKEPEIFGAIKKGAILENIILTGENNAPDYEDTSITQNTRVSYPIHHIENIKSPSKGSIPKHIFFLTCDAFGVLPPISKLARDQAMYHFISGYTAKVAGTEDGVVEPEATFSACFGAPFLPLHPTAYADMLGEKIDKYETQVWLINTGWTGGPYGIGNRIKLKYTRAMINAALNGQLDIVTYTKTDIFGLNIPTFCPGVPIEVLNPEGTWSNKFDYKEKAEHLADLFNRNFEQFEDKASASIKSAAPQIAKLQLV